MRYFASFILLYLTNSLCVGGDNSRLLVVSGTADSSSAPCEIRLMEVESEKVMATAQVGATAETVLSPDGKLLCCVSQYMVAGVNQPKAKLQVFNTNDLSIVKSGVLPVQRNVYFRAPSFSPLIFSPDSSQVLIQKMTSYKTNEKPIRLTVDDVMLTRLELSAGDDDEAFKALGEPTKVPRARAVQFLRVADWPRIVLWNHHLGAIEVINTNTGTIDKRLPLGDDTQLDTIDPEVLESPNIGKLILRLGFRGSVITDDGEYAYYIPQQPAQPGQPRFVGRIRRISIREETPKVLVTSELAPHLRAKVATVSKVAGALFVVENKTADNGYHQLPSARIKCYQTTDLKPITDIQLSITDCDYLVVSRDGTVLYALNEEGVISVVEVTSGKERKILKNVGTRPAIAYVL